MTVKQGCDCYLLASDFFRDGFKAQVLLLGFEEG
jgi:hypothetical protein